jgi:hypothetical protein
VAVALLLLLVTAAAPAMGLEPAASRYSIELFSVNAGGSAGMSGSLYTLGVTAGQPAAGQLAGAVYNAQIGFWGGAAIEACPVILTGDADQSSEIKLSDVILLVNYVLKAGAVPVPCAAAGDVNCDGAVKLSDVIGLVNYVLKAGTPPCDVCTLIPGNWTCP